MKHTLTLSVSLLASCVALAGPEDYVNFVRQIQQDSGVEWDVTVAPQGSMLSPEGVGPQGSLFQLWSIHNESGAEYHLDEEFVSSYSPTSAIEIQTADPYPHIARTRVDQPFAVRINVGGLQHGTGGPTDPPPSAGQVYLRHATGNYPAGQHSFPENSDGNHHHRFGAVINQNGMFVLNYGYTNLRGPNLTKVEGEEVWSISALVDALDPSDPMTEGEILESATLQVWPIADAEISGIDTEEDYANVPPLTVTLNDLYPDSTTYLRVYRGAPTPNPSEFQEIISSYVIIQDSIPQDRTLNLADLDEYFEEVGSYTVEVLHRTPFGTDLLERVYPLKVRRTIKVRGSIYSK